MIMSSILKGKSKQDNLCKKLMDIDKKDSFDHIWSFIFVVMADLFTAALILL